MSVLASTIIDRAAAILNDGMLRWEKAELVDWLNEGQQALVKLPSKMDAKVVTKNVQLEQGARQHLPVDGIALIAVVENVGGAAVLPCAKALLDAFSPGWTVRPTASYVTNYMPGEHPETFYVSPAQNSTPASVVLTYTANPKAVNYDESIDVRDIYADNLVDYVLYRAFSKDAEFAGSAERAIAHYQAFSQ